MSLGRDSGIELDYICYYATYLQPHITEIYIFPVPSPTESSRQRLSNPGTVFAVYQDGSHPKIASERSMPFDEIDGVGVWID
jgi:hypothetical protein